MAEIILNDPLKPTNHDLELDGQAKLLISAYGLGALKTKLYRVDKDEQSDAFIEATEQSDGRGRFAQLVFDTLTFSGSDPKVNGLSYTSLEGEAETIAPLEMKTVLISMTQVKNIKKTPIQGRNGTVKEYISDGDFSINIKILLTSDRIDVEPVVEKGQLIKYCKAPIEIACSSRYLQSFGVLSLVIDKYKFRQLEGKRNVVACELTCSSETPFEIPLSNE